MRLSFSNLVNALLLALVLGVGSWVYAGLEKAEKLSTELAVAQSEQKQLKQDVQELKEDVKDLKETQKADSAEQKELLKEIIANQKKKK